MSTGTVDQGSETALVLGGSSGIGKEVARFLAERGARVVLSGRTKETAQRAADEIGRGVTGIALDLAEPTTIGAALADVGPVDHLVLVAIERGANSVANFDVASATRLVTLKLVGYTEVIHVLRDRLTPSSSVVLFGGLAMERPYPGSTMVSTVNGGVTGLVRSLAIELAPLRFNAIHPGIVGDSPAWLDKDNGPVIARTPIGRLITMDEIVQAVVFLLDNGAVNGENLVIDGGWLLT